MIPPCRKVVATAGCRVPPEGFLRRGGCVRHLQTELGPTEECWVSPLYTEVAEVEDVKVREEGNYYVIEASNEVYVYPADVLKKMLEWWQSCTPLVILTGPPGTGKTSLATFVFPAVVGAGSKWATTDSIFSKWVGESERNIRRLIEETIESRPQVTVIDEGDVLVASAEWGGRGSESTLFAVQNIAKSRFAWLARKCARDPVYSTAKFIITTNLTENDILPEFKRSGRGQVVHVPLPDKKGYSLLVSLLEAKYKVSFPADFVEYAARRLTPADVVDYALRLAKGEKPSLPSGIVTTLPVPTDYKPPPPAGPACQRLQAGVHYHAEVSGAKTPLHKVHAVADFVASCGTPPVVVRKLDREHVAKSIALAVSSKRPLVVFPPVPLEVYLVLFYDVREVPVVFVEGIERFTLEPLTISA